MQMKKKIGLLVSGLLSFVAAFGLAACEGETKVTYDYGDTDFSGIYDDIYDGLYTTYDQTDGRITLPTAGTEYYSVDDNDNIVRMRLDKIEYQTTTYKTIEEVYVEIKVYCTITSGEGAAGLGYAMYDKDGYLMEDGYLVKNSVSAGDKIVFTDTIFYSFGQTKYLLGGYRYVLNSISKE